MRERRARATTSSSSTTRIVRRCGRAAPASVRSSGRPNSSKVTSADTGLPGSPSHGAPNSVPNAERRARPHAHAPERERAAERGDDGARVVEVAHRHAARRQDQVAPVGGAQMRGERRWIVGRDAERRPARHPRRAPRPRASSCSTTRCAGRRAPRRTRSSGTSSSPVARMATRGRRCTTAARTADGRRARRRARHRAWCPRARTIAPARTSSPRSADVRAARRGRRGSRRRPPPRVGVLDAHHASPRPRGTGAPVMMRAASPRTDARASACCPAAIVLDRRAASPGGPPIAPRTSAARTAKPSMLALSHSGSDTGDTTSRASTRPSASRSAIGSSPSGARRRRACARSPRRRPAA